MKTFIFNFFQSLGFHVLRNSYSNPIPDTEELSRKKAFWKEKSDLVGLKMNITGQLHFLHNVFPLYLDECNFPRQKTNVAHEYYVYNWFFGLLSATVLHCMIRHFTPKTLIEVGSGYSTYVSARASLFNKKEGRDTALIAIEPNPNNILRTGFPGLTRLVCKKVQDLDLNFFEQLGEGDILFVDSSHVIKIGGDVTFLYLEVFPRLTKGVIIHIHDVFFPFDYPQQWVINERRFWNEQYFLHAFLMHNDAFQVLWSDSFMMHSAKNELEGVFPGKLGFNENRNSNSFWMKKII